MPILIVILLAIIAIAVAPWLVGVLALALGAYGMLALAAAGVVFVVLLGIGLWQGASMLRVYSANKRAAEKHTLEFQKTLAEQAIKAQEARRKAEAKAEEDAVEADRKEQARIKRLVPCPHCSSQIARGGIYCPVCGKPPIAA